MSFGVSVSDLITVISLAKDTVQYCRHAPSDFAEASRLSQSLYLILEGVKTEYQNLDSPLHKEDRTRTDFAIHFKNCERSLKPLTELIVKHKRLATSSIRIIDRARFPKKDYLEYRGNLAFYTARLSEFLQVVGLGSLGRIEQKIEDIKGDLPIVMSKLDQMCAEFRIMGDRESLLSDHTDDEKLVWKTFRSKLNEAGFTSNVLREHEAAIFLRIRELTKCGLLDTDGSSSLWTSDETLSSALPVHQNPFHSNSKRASAESDADSEKTISPKLSVKDLRPGDDDRYDNVPRTEIKSSSAKPRVWRNVKGDIILKGTLSTEISRSGQSFVAIVDSDKQEVLIPQSNLSEVDWAYINCPMQYAAVENEKARVQEEDSLPKHQPAAPKKASDVHDSKDEPIDLPRRTRPDILVGKRTRTQIRWTFREEGSELPQIAPYRSRRSLTANLLPEAASRGDLKRVKKLLASGEHIESKGPQSWTEEVTDAGSEAPSTTKIRHTYPETTALYRAACQYDQRRTALYKSGGNDRSDVVELLLRYGADPDLGYGRLGETKIYNAAWYNKLEVVELLLKFGADVNIRNRKMMESYKGVGEKVFHGILSGLSKDHAIMNAWGKVALHAAAYQGHEDMVQVLLSAGADLEAVGNDGTTPLYLAAQQKHKGVVQILLQKGAHLQTERHDPVLALLNERNKKKNSGSKELIRKDDHEKEMIKRGTTDFLVSLVADCTKSLSSSRRLDDY